MNDGWQVVIHAPLRTGVLEVTPLTNELVHHTAFPKCLVGEFTSQPLLFRFPVAKAGKLNLSIPALGRELAEQLTIAVWVELDHMIGRPPADNVKHFVSRMERHSGTHYAAAAGPLSRRAIRLLGRTRLRSSRGNDDYQEVP